MAPIIIIGTGTAGYTVAREFRKLEPEAPLLIISAEDGRSYPKPMLSNALSKGKAVDQIAMFNVYEMSAKLDAEIMINKVVSNIDPKTETIMLADGTKRNYSQLVLALGAQPIRINMRGGGEENVISINSLSDYEAFRTKLVDAEKVAVLGPGLVGCELANDLVNSGVGVSVIGPDRYAMSSLLPEFIGKELTASLEKAGVNWYLETTVSGITRTDKGAYVLTLSNGGTIKADIVVSAIGLRPNTDLAKVAGLEVSKGIVTNNKLQTSQANIYALGDCAEVAGHNLLFIAPILLAAKALAKSLTGISTMVRYPAMPVVIKTPAYPLVVASPASGSIGEWEQVPDDTVDGGSQALFIGDNGDLLGFVLGGDAIAEKKALTQRLPDLLS